MVRYNRGEILTKMIVCIIILVKFCVWTILSQNSSLEMR